MLNSKKNKPSPLKCFAGDGLLFYLLNNQFSTANIGAYNV